MTPRRIQLSRAKGWRKPANAVVVSRPSRWGNPFRIGQPAFGPGSGIVRDARHAVDLYELHTGPMGNHELDLDEVRRELAGRDLACWCSLDDRCHGDHLLALANPALAAEDTNDA